MYIPNVYNALPCYNNVRTSQVSLINLRWEQPHWGEGFLFPMDVFMIHFLFLRVVVALRFSRYEGDVTSFPPRINTVLGVLVFSSLCLFALFAYVHTLVSKGPILLLTSSLQDLWRLWSELTYFSIHKNEDCIVFLNLKHYSRFSSHQQSM